ncbi:MAG: hypothetical protein HY023_03235 [Chloroflexi bacterium]|nr:hypothetical protein [Chloroflexota bacterium]MBI3760475.1 hypothetical protein [Chloroflexota bacterium]
MAEKNEEPREKKYRIPEETREHLKAAREEMRKSFETLFPPGFIEHRRAARKELLKAARSLIDHALDRMEEGEKN